LIIRDLRQFSSLFRQYTELRSQENRVLSIAYLQGNLVQNVRNATSGISAGCIPAEAGVLPPHLINQR